MAIYPQDSTKIERLEKSIKSIKPFRSEFTQEYYDTFQDKTLISSGTLVFMQPGLMKWTYKQPEEMIFVVGREKVWLYDPILENVTIQRLDRVSGIKSLRFLSGDEKISLLFREIESKRKLVDDSNDHLYAVLAPVEENQALAELQLLMDTKSNRILQFVLIDHNDNYRKVTIDNWKLDQSIEATEFEFTVTEDMEVIQGISN